MLKGMKDIDNSHDSGAKIHSSTSIYGNEVTHGIVLSYNDFNFLFLIMLRFVITMRVVTSSLLFFHHLQCLNSKWKINYPFLSV